METSRHSESPLLKLRQEAEAQRRSYAHQWGVDSPAHERILLLVTEGEERWLLERELHKSQVVKIRKQRHEYIMLLRTQVWLLAEDLYEHGCAWARKGFDTPMTGLFPHEPTPYPVAQGIHRLIRLERDEMATRLWLIAERLWQAADDDAPFWADAYILIEGLLP